jgi:hypothetical protein
MIVAPEMAVWRRTHFTGKEISSARNWNARSYRGRYVPANGSERDPTRDLDHSGRILLARCFAKRSYRKIVNIRVWLVKAYAIKGVEEIGAELKGCRFPDLKILYC